MTEKELRASVAAIMTGWLGAVKGSAKHREILDTYNAHKPLARGYAVQAQDPYCATTVSAAWIKAGIADYTGTECGCEELVKIAQARGIWVEDDAYRPQVGDAILYDWDDTGAGDCKGWSDHIGIVTKVSGVTFTVTEGNMSGGMVGVRTVSVNARYIRGYICPDYAGIAAKMQQAAAPAQQKIYRVQVGAFTVRASADAYLARLKAAGFEGYVVEGQK